MASSRRFYVRLWEAKHRDTLIIAFLWLIAVAGALTRPFLPIDETRYVSVAWEMWHSHSWWVPLMNGEAYADKPPLLFWLIHIGWGAFGVNDWWPKLIGPLASLVAMIHLYRVARRLGYAGSRARLAPMLMMAMLMWSLYSSALMFDILLTACLLGAISPLIQGQLTTRKSLVSGVWLGLALLAKGPAVFITLVPILLAMPWWRETQLGREGRMRLGLSLLIGTSILLCWALSASWLGGSSYGRELLWGQSVDRLHDAMAHARPLWWYIPWLPLITFPWMVWPATWPRLPRFRYQRLAWVWLVIPLIVFSLISGKQIHYLMPLIPALALVIMDRIGQSELDSNVLSRTRAPALAIGLLGVVGLLLMIWGKGAMGPSTISPLGAFALIAWACLLWRWRWTSGRAAVRGIALGTSLAVLIATQFMLGPFWNRFDVRPPSALLAQLESQDIPVAFNGDGYQATFQFAGRLKRPLMTLDGSTTGMCEFKKQFPSGWIVARNRDVNHLIVDDNAAHTFKYRGGQLVIVPVHALFPSGYEADCSGHS
ncbi:ArnT family glycosyltransferase [Salinicola salarius]|uniref:ArnT family glycosyltransferase n=1 Tax=Salinicola salarius TaxID=430457 RepID=UPI001300B2C1|nr:glycosyltransferase family 39 protein [Salinicola salarius]